MLRFSSYFIERPILSLRSTTRIGDAHHPILNPTNLKIEGWYANERGDKSARVLLSQEVREIITKGIIVNDHDALTSPEDLIRHQELIALNYELIDKKVITESGKKLGKVAEYAVDETTMLIEKLYVSRSILRSLSTEQLVIDRKQVLETTDESVIVADNTLKQRSVNTATAPAA